MSEKLSEVTKARDTLNLTPIIEGDLNFGNQILGDHKKLKSIDDETGPRGEIIYVDPASEKIHY